MSEPVKITRGTRVVVEIGGADFDVGKVYELTWAPVEDYVFKVASPDGTVSKIPMQAGPPRMHLTLCCESTTGQEGNISDKSL